MLSDYLDSIPAVSDLNFPGLLSGIVPSPRKVSQQQTATGKTRGMPLVGIGTTGKFMKSPGDEEQWNNIQGWNVGNGSHVGIQAEECMYILKACI